MTPTKQIASDVLITAVEGGSGYWAAFRNYTTTKEPLGAVSVEVRDAESGGTWHKVTLADVTAAIKKVASGSVKVHSSYVRRMAIMVVRPDDADYDATDADIVLQVAVLGDVIYG